MRNNKHKNKDKRGIDEWDEKVMQIEEGPFDYGFYFYGWICYLVGQMSEEG